MKRLLLTTLLALSLVLPVQGEEGGFELAFINNSGGLNTKASHFALQPNETPDCQNVYFGIDGSIKKRNGYVKLNDTVIAGTPTITGMHQFIKKTGVNYLVVTAGDKVFQSTNITSAIYTDITGSATITPEFLFDFETFQNSVIMTNNRDVPLEWDSTGDVSAAAVPTDLNRAKWVAQFKNYVFYANVRVGSTTHPSRFYYSNLLDKDTWTATDFIDLSPDDGEAIEGVEVLGDRLVFFKKTKVYMVLYTGDIDIPFIVVQSPSSRGTVSGYAIEEISGSLVYLYQDGIYAFDGSYSYKISTKIDPTIEAYNKNRFEYVTGIKYETLNQYWLTFASAGGSDNSEVIIYDYANQAFTRYTNVPAAYMLNLLYNNDEFVYFGGYDGYTYKFNSEYNDDGAAIDAYFWTKWHDFTAPTRKKAIKHLTLHVEDVGNYNISMGYNYDHRDGIWRTQNINMSGGGATVGTAIVGSALTGSSGGLIKRTDIGGQGYVFRVKFQNSLIGEHFNIRGYTVIGSIRGFR